VMEGGVKEVLDWREEQLRGGREALRKSFACGRRAVSRTVAQAALHLSGKSVYSTQSRLYDLFFTLSLRVILNDS